MPLNPYIRGIIRVSNSTKSASKFGFGIIINEAGEAIAWGSIEFECPMELLYAGVTLV